MDSESKYMKKKGVILLAVLGLAVIGFAETWRLGSNQDWQPVNEQGDSAFVSAATQAKQFVSTGKAVKAKKAFSDLKKQFPELAGDDFDAYVKAELLYANRKFSDAAKAYDKRAKEAFGEFSYCNFS